MQQAVLIVQFLQWQRATIFRLGTLWASEQDCREWRRIELMYRFFKSNQQWSFQRTLPRKSPLTLVKESFWAKASWRRVFQAETISCKSLLAFVKLANLLWTCPNRWMTCDSSVRNTWKTWVLKKKFRTNRYTFSTSRISWSRNKS